MIDEMITMADVSFPNTIRDKKIHIIHSPNSNGEDCKVNYDFCIGNNKFEYLSGLDEYNDKIIFRDMPLVKVLEWVTIFTRGKDFILSDDIQGNPVLTYNYDM